jgi:DeoR family fructose operon transcriptional repressor
MAAIGLVSPLGVTSHSSAPNRRSQLLKLLHEESALSVQFLSKQLSVSTPTIRRDLDALQKNGMVERIHGGARLLRSAQREIDKHEVAFFVRRDAAVNAKRAIARVARQFFERGEIIFLDASTTALYLIQEIPDDLPMTIVTHSAYLPVELAGRTDLQVISTGGVLDTLSLCYLGGEAERSVRQFSAHRAFFGAEGVSLIEGCTDPNLMDIQLKAVMVQRAQELFILADHRKLGKSALGSFASLDQVRVLITDEQADPTMVQAIRGRGVQVILASLA